MTRDSGSEQPGHTLGEDRWLLVAVAGVLAFVAMLDMNIVNVALADIADGLHVSAATAQWAVLGYQLPVVALLLPVGRWLDGAGMRPALLAATAGFAPVQRPGRRRALGGLADRRPDCAGRVRGGAVRADAGARDALRTARSCAGGR